MILKKYNQIVLWLRALLQLNYKIGTVTGSILEKERKHKTKIKKGRTHNLDGLQVVTTLIANARKDVFALNWREKTGERSLLFEALVIRTVFSNTFRQQRNINVMAVCIDGPDGTRITRIPALGLKFRRAYTKLLCVGYTSSRTTVQRRQID